jgi:hypothetical protein
MHANPPGIVNQPVPDETATAPKIRVGVGPRVADSIDDAAQQNKLVAARQRALEQAEFDVEAEREMQAEREAEEAERANQLTPRRFSLPPLGPPAGPRKRDEPEGKSESESQFTKNMREFTSLRLRSPSEAAMFAMAGPAGVVTMRGVIKAHNEPVIRHVNPNYPPPPCMPQEIVNIQNDILQALDSRAEAEGVAAAMAAQEKHHKDNEKPLTDMQKGSENQLTATEAHKQAVARRTEANNNKRDDEKKVEGKVEHYWQEAGKLAAIKTPMYGFKRFTGLAYSLPDSPDVLVSVKRSLIRMNGDTTRFLDQLAKMDEEMSQQRASEGNRQQGIQKDANTLFDTEKKANDSKEAFVKAQETTEELDKDNKARKDESAKMKGEATADAHGLQTDADQKKAKAASMAAALQSWAQNHRQARLDALNQTKENLENQGYRVTEVKEL